MLRDKKVQPTAPTNVLNRYQPEMKLTGAGSQLPAMDPTRQTVGICHRKDPRGHLDFEQTPTKVTTAQLPYLQVTSPIAATHGPPSTPRMPSDLRSRGRAAHHLLRDDLGLYGVENEAAKAIIILHTVIQ